AGVTTIEHGVRNGNAIDEATLEALREKEIVYVPTLGQEPGAEKNIPALLAAGVAIGVGTDVGDYHEELARLADAGMPAADVLLAATRNGAKALLRGDELGTIEEGSSRISSSRPGSRGTTCVTCVPSSPWYKAAGSSWTSETALRFRSFRTPKPALPPAHRRRTPRPLPQRNR
ncbi:MAG TPA: amidohydrolase family protein, partial [Gammaproteobacteria bacterium]